MIPQVIPSLSSVALIAKNYLSGFNNKIGDLVIDYTESEIIEHSTTITNHPVSSGGNISDHVYNNPIIIKLDGSITDNSLYTDINTLTGFFQGNVISNIYNYITGPSQKQIFAFNFLETLKANKALITVVAKMKSYDNMIIESLSFSTDKSTGNRLMFNITLKQITFVTSKIVNISKPVFPSKKIEASNLSSMGAGNLINVEQQQKEQYKTKLKKDVESIGKLFR